MDPVGGNIEWGSLTRDFEGFFLHVYLGSFFLNPEDVVNISMGAIWNFDKGTGLL
jgi:hypothetical protein